jgi:Flp pilus assembly protein TadG
MRRHSKGQSLVEMALMLPMLLLVLFGIIDLGYYIYGYSTIYFAARNASEVAAELPPQVAQLSNPSDRCTDTIIQAAKDSVPLFSGLTTTISYPSTRTPGEPIQVRVQYQIQPLTPLFQLVRFGDSQGRLSVDISARRSIEMLANGPISPKNPRGLVC